MIDCEKFYAVLHDGFLNIYHENVSSMKMLSHKIIHWRHNFPSKKINAVYQVSNIIKNSLYGNRYLKTELLYSYWYSIVFCTSILVDIRLSLRGIRGKVSRTWITSCVGKLQTLGISIQGTVDGWRHPSLLVKITRGAYWLVLVVKGSMVHGWTR